jgi:hypothetical protein
MSLIPSNRRSLLVVLLGCWIVLGADHPAGAQGFRRIGRPLQPGMINLPYTSTDNQGTQWMVYQPGMLRMQGNMPVFAQAGQLVINGNQPNMMNNLARLDEKTGELILENMQAAGMTVTRRILFNNDDAYVRIIDIIQNNQAQDQQVNLQFSTTLNFGVQTSTMVPDRKKKDQNLAWVAQVAGINKAGVDLYAGKGAKLAPILSSAPGNNMVQATLNTTIPAGKQIAVVHFHATAASLDQGVQWVNNIKEDKLLADVPRDLRKLILNFQPHESLLGDLEILRGDVLDTIELHSGDKFNGNLKEDDYKLDTFYGTIDLQANQIVSILNAGRFRPRQLLVTADGQIFGGHLQKQTIDLELASGQKTQIPLLQISRIGYRLRPDESDDTQSNQTLKPPYVLMTSGDRVGVEMPPGPIEVSTRYGLLELSPTVISSIAFTSDDTGVHTIFLVDGSHFNGLIMAPEFEMKLSNNGKEQVVKFPVSSLSQLVLKNMPEDASDPQPTLQLRKDDVLVGTLAGDLKLDTAFDTITLNAAETRSLSHTQQNSPDVSAVTWDGTVLSGQLEEPEVLCHLVSGVDMHVPISLLRNYNNPQTAAPALMVDRIKAIVADLNADDWKQRDAAEKQLLAIGPGAISTLKSLHDAQPPEAQQRIDSVLKVLDKQGSKNQGLPTGEQEGGGLQDPK